jgi:hypothetical protein
MSYAEFAPRSPPSHLGKSGRTRWATVSTLRLAAAPRHSLLPDVAKICAFVQTNDKIRLILLIQTCEDQRQALLFASPADADARNPVT